ncbi:MAG: LEA type 2 family protein [Flavisolibacter sp.]|nr:LEA type 2 family protein [Flavisolibacter sp.]
MKASSKRMVWFGFLVVVILGIGIWWWQSSSIQNGKLNLSGKRGENTPQDLLSNTANEAKEKAVRLTMQTASMSITDIEAGRIKVANKVIIKNPLPVPLNASRYDYAALINGVKVAEGTYNKPIHVPATGSETITLPMEVMIKPMEKVIDQMNAAGKDTATYTFLNTIHTDIPIAGERKFTFNLKEELPIVRLLKMKPGDLEVKKFGLKHSGIKMTMHVTNPNPFTIRMKDGRYSMTIDDKTTMEGTLQDVVTLPAKETVPVTMHMDMRTGRALKMGWKMLFDKKDTRYQLTFDSNILSESKLLRNSSMHFREEGVLADLKEAIKKE